MTDKLVLASKSPFRSALLKNAGIEFSTASADIDERAVEAPLYETGLRRKKSHRFWPRRRRST